MNEETIVRKVQDGRAEVTGTLSDGLTEDYIVVDYESGCVRHIARPWRAAEDDALRRCLGLAGK